MKRLDITSMSDYKKVEAVVQLLINGTLTSYRVATDANVSKMSILTLAKGTSKIKNIPTASPLATHSPGRVGHIPDTSSYRPRLATEGSGSSV